MNSSARAHVVSLAAALALIAGCHSMPSAPLGADTDLSITSSSPPAGVPSLRDVDLIRTDDALRTVLAFVPPTLDSHGFMSPSEELGRSWSFRLWLDVDRDGAADFSVSPAGPGEVELTALSGTGGTTRLATTAGPSTIAFALPATTLADADGMLDYVLDVFHLDGQGGQDRVSQHTGTSDPARSEFQATPALTRIQSEVRGNTLYIRGHFLPRVPGSTVTYDPYHPGGWFFQVLLNTDQQDSGYWLGYDYIVRGGEWDQQARTIAVRRITLEDGWGPSSGQAGLNLTPRDFQIALPLGARGIL